MKEQNNAVCCICGNAYHLCMSCKDKMKLTPWKMYTDTAEHYKIHQIIHGFSTGVYTKDEIREKLKNVNLSDLETFRPHIKAIIKDALKEESVKNEVEEKIEESIKTEETTDDVVNEKTIVSRKRYYKAETE